MNYPYPHFNHGLLNHPEFSDRMNNNLPHKTMELVPVNPC